MTLAEVMFSIAESNPNCKKFRFVTRTIPHLNKKSRSTGKPTDFSVEKRSEFIASLGVNYENEVNDILESQGKKRNFEAQKAPGKHYVNGTNWLMESDKTPGVFYIALSRFEDRKSKYYINGVEVTPEQLDDLRENYLPKYNKVNNNPDKPFVEWQTYLIENIISIEAI
jgi:hypothetical protein